MTEVTKENSLKSDHQNIKKSNVNTKIENSMNCKYLTNQKLKVRPFWSRLFEYIPNLNSNPLK